MNSEKIKILQVLEAVAGGTKKAFYLQLKYLDQEKFDVTVCLPKSSITAKTRVKELNDPIFAETLRSEGFTVVEIDMRGDSLSPLQNARAALQLYKLCRRTKYHIIHGHSSTGGFLARLVAQFTGIPVAVYSPEGFVFNPFISASKRILYVFLERVAGFFTDALVACSQEEKEVAIRAKIVDERKIHVIENPLEIGRYDLQHFDIRRKKVELGIKERRPVIGMVARLVPQKKPGDFIQAAALIAARQPDVQFILVGDGRLMDEIEYSIRVLGLQSNFLLLGNREDYLDIMACFDIFVLSSLWEGLPYAPVEALLLGKPVVLTDVTGARDILGSEGSSWLVPPENPGLLAGQILQMLESIESAKEIAQHLQRNIRSRFDAEVTSRKMMDLYLRLLNGG